jgi:hypothetical protein
MATANTEDDYAETWIAQSQRGTWSFVGDIAAFSHRNFVA